MKNLIKGLLAIALIASIFFLAATQRYEMQVVDALMVTRIDRLTGAIESCNAFDNDKTEWCEKYFE